MTDIISNINKVQKLTQVAPRRVCLQQNREPNKSHDTNNQQVSPLFLLSNSGTPIKPNTCQTILPSCIPSFTRLLEPIDQSLKKSSIKTQPTAIAKSVRFHKQLTQILHFYTPPHIDEDDQECYNNNDLEEVEEEEENELEDAFLELFSKRLGITSSSEFALNLYHPAIQQHILDSSASPRLRLILPNWPSAHPTKRFITQIVSLEKLYWDSARCIIKGYVLVHNLAFEKKVTIRISFDHWETWQDLEATYRESSNGDALDRFIFELSPTRVNENSDYRLAVRYQVNGCEYWDNNNENNFTLRWATSSSCGDNINNESKENKSRDSNQRDNRVASVCQQEQRSAVLTSIKFQEKNDRKKDEYFVSFCESQYNNSCYIAPPLSLSDIPEKKKTSNTTQEISAHLSLYLERKRRSEERQKKHLLDNIVPVVNAAPTLPVTIEWSSISDVMISP